MAIVIKNVSKHFGSFQALDGVNLEIETGSLVALLGPSGSGKSTLLRLIAGLESPDTGAIWLRDRNVTYQNVQERNIGFVFQHYALFKHLTVYKNIAFGLEINKVPPREVKARVEELIELIQLTGLGDRYPSQLSGGQRQRVALARALASHPQVLLLDEPFGALDAKVRKDLRAWLRRLHEQVRVTTIFVTHDQQEAMEVADKIVVMNRGQVEQVGSPDAIYNSPATPFVMSFIGPVNVLPSHLRLFHGVNLNATNPQIFLRPHDLLIETTPNSSGTKAKIGHLVNLGWQVEAELILEGEHTIQASLSRDQFEKLRLKAGQQVYVTPKEIKSFPQASQLVGTGI